MLQCYKLKRKGLFISFVWFPMHPRLYVSLPIQSVVNIFNTCKTPTSNLIKRYNIRYIFQLRTTWKRQRQNASMLQIKTKRSVYTFCLFSNLAKNNYVHQCCTY